MVYRIGGVSFLALGVMLGAVGLLLGGQALLRLGFGAVTFASLGASCYLSGSGSGGRRGGARAGPQDHDGDVV